MSINALWAQNHDPGFPACQDLRNHNIKDQSLMLHLRGPSHFRIWVILSLVPNIMYSAIPGLECLIGIFGLWDKIPQVPSYVLINISQGLHLIKFAPLKLRTLLYWSLLLFVFPFNLKWISFMQLLSPRLFSTASSFIMISLLTKSKSKVLSSLIVLERTWWRNVLAIASRKTWILPLLV